MHVQSRVTLRVNPGLVGKLQSINRDDLDKIFAALQCKGGALANAMKTLSEPARDLYNAFRATANRVPGSSQSMLTLRSSLWAYYDVMQTFTMNLTLNPGDLSSHTVFATAAPDWSAEDPSKRQMVTSFKYAHGDDGLPDARRPGAADRWKIIAANPVACSDYFKAVIAAFCKHFLGFDPGRSTQARPKWCASLRLPCSFPLLTPSAFTLLAGAAPSFTRGVFHFPAACSGGFWGTTSSSR